MEGVGGKVKWDAKIFGMTCGKCGIVLFGVKGIILQRTKFCFHAITLSIVAPLRKRKNLSTKLHFVYWWSLCCFYITEHAAFLVMQQITIFSLIFPTDLYSMYILVIRISKKLKVDPGWMIIIYLLTVIGTLIGFLALYTLMYSPLWNKLQYRDTRIRIVCFC